MCLAVLSATHHDQARERRYWYQGLVQPLARCRSDLNIHCGPGKSDLSLGITLCRQLFHSFCKQIFTFDATCVI